MGLFKSIFGGKEKINIGELLQVVVESGGQATAKIECRDFAEYLQKNGEQTPSELGVISGFLRIAGEKRKVEFMSGLLRGVDEGETFINISNNAWIEERFDNTAELITYLSGDIKELITTKNEALKVSYQIFSLSNTAYFTAYQARGETKIPDEENYPPILREFLNIVGDSEDNLKNEFNNIAPNIDFLKVNAVFTSLTKDISDPDLQLIINYGITEELIQEWGLINSVASVDSSEFILESALNSNELEDSITNKTDSELRLVSLIKKQEYSENGAFFDIFYDLHHFFGMVHIDGYSNISFEHQHDTSSLIRMSYGYLLRIVLAGLYTQGIVPRSRYEEASRLFKLLQQSTNQTKEFQIMAHEQAVELFHSYNKRIDRDTMTALVTNLEGGYHNQLENGETYGFDQLMLILDDMAN